MPAIQETACNAGHPGLHPWVHKIPWRRKWQPTSIFLPGKSHGQRRVQSMGSQRVGHDWATKPLLFIRMRFYNSQSISRNMFLKGTLNQPCDIIIGGFITPIFQLSKWSTRAVQFFELDLVYYLMQPSFESLYISLSILQRI